MSGENVTGGIELKLKSSLSPDTHNQDTIMKKYILIVDALRIIAGLLRGETFEGKLYLDKETHVLTFKAWNRRAPKYKKPRKLCDLDGGWLGETNRHIVRYEKFAKSLGLPQILRQMDNDNRQSKEMLVDIAIIDNV